MSGTMERDLDDFFELVGGLSDMALREVASSWHQDETDPAHVAAAEHGRQVVKARGRQQTLDDAFADLRSWLNRRTGDRAGIFGVTSQDRIEAAGEAIPALVDALLAIIAADDLSQDERDALLLPLRQAVGRDAGAEGP